MGWTTALMNDSEDIFTKKRYDITMKKFRKVSVESAYKNRLDLVAADILQDKTAWWVLAEINNIIFPFDEIGADFPTIDVCALSAITQYDQTLTDATLEVVRP